MATLGSPPEPKARGRGDATMDRDGFVEFVRWTFVERKTNGSKVATGMHSKCRNHSLLTLECDCTIHACGLYKPAS